LKISLNGSYFKQSVQISSGAAVFPSFNQENAIPKLAALQPMRRAGTNCDMIPSRPRDPPPMELDHGFLRGCGFFEKKGTPMELPIEEQKTGQCSKH
jgi:hypothetical protein